MLEMLEIVEECSLQSHTALEVVRAIVGGQQVWLFDSGGRGDDDLLIGSEEENLYAILHFYMQDGEEEKDVLARFAASINPMTLTLFAERGGIR